MENLIWSYTHLPLIEKIAKLGKPALISTGMSDFDEIKDAIDTFYQNGNRQIGIFQCTSIYPLKPENIYLSRISELKRIFDQYFGIFPLHCDVTPVTLVTDVPYLLQS